MKVLGEANFFRFSQHGEGECIFAFLEDPPTEPEDADEEVLGLFKAMRGTIEVTTALPVVSSAGNPSLSGTTYTWKVEGLAANMPQLVMKLK